MTDTEFLADQLRRAHSGEAWHGPSLREALAGITPPMAATSPAPHVHSIWEIVRHIAAWLPAVGRRLDGEAVELPHAQDWPASNDFSETAWQNTLAALDRDTSKLQERIAKLSPDALRKSVPGANYSTRFMLEGVIQHHLYHAGQIGVLKKIVA